MSHIEAHARICAYLTSPGVNLRRAALAASLSWHAVSTVRSGDPKLSTLLKLEAIIPPDFAPPPPVDSSLEG